MKNMMLIIRITFLLIQFSLYSQKANRYLSMPVEIEKDFVCEFKDEERSGNFSNFLYFNNSLYVTGTNYVYRLNSANISDKNPKSYKESFINPTNNLFKNSSSMKNFIKLLILREKTQDIIICGTNLGKPHIKDLNVDDFSSIVEFDGHYLCPGIENYQNLGLISYDNTLNLKKSNKELMYSAIWKTNRVYKANGIFSRYGIYRQEIDETSKILKSFPDLNWLWEPNFISMIDYMDKIYYFFTELSIEEFSETKKLKRVSRVARVCKNDHGVKSEKYPDLNNIWLSFRKAFFTCDEKFQNLIHIKKAGKKVISIFYDENIGSVLCETDMEHIKNMLNIRKFWINRSIDLKNQNIKFLDNDLSCDELYYGQTIHESFVNDHHLGEEDYDYYRKDTLGSNSKNVYFQNQQDVEELNVFLSQNTLLNSRIISYFQLNLPYKITSIDLNLNIEENYLTVFFGTTIGILIILKKNLNKYEEPFYFKFKSLDDVNISEILVHDRNIYVSSQIGIYQIKYLDLMKNYCENIYDCIGCIRFSFCSWISERCMFDEFVKNSISKCNLITKKLNFTEGQNAKLKCHFENLGPYVFWKKDQNWINQTKIEYYLYSDVLYLVNLTLDYNGTYSCFSEYNEFNYNNYDLKVSKSIQGDNITVKLDGNFENYYQNFTKYLEIINEINEEFNRECARFIN